jgi:hypothetical protein
MILRYLADDAGWARLVINSGEKLVSAPVSYEHDSFRDLLAGTLGILEGASQVGIVFIDHESGEHHLNIRRVERGQIELQVVRYPGGRIWDGASWTRPGAKADVRFSCPSTVWELRDQVLASAEALAKATAKATVETLGLERDRRVRGRREFPLELIQRLREMDLRVRLAPGELTLECCGERVTMNASSLDELRSGLSAREATVRFGETEGEHRLKLRRIEDDRIALEVVWWWNQREDDYGTVVFRCETSLGRLHAEVLGAARDSTT